MTEAAAPRQRGSVRRRRDRWQVRVSAGKDPITGERIILTDSVVIERPGNSRSERKAFKEAEKRLGVDTTLKELRHYSATEFLTSGVDLRTVAGRLGHGDGTTTLRYYAAWVGAADQAAAVTIGGRMPIIRGVSGVEYADSSRARCARGGTTRSPW